MGDLSTLRFSTEYRSLKSDPVADFYRPCLLNSTLYKRAAGYFRSSVYTVIGAPLLEFARRGGYVQLICSPHLSPDDIDKIAEGYARRDELIAERTLADVERLLSDEATAQQARLLATLIAVGALDLKLAIRADGKGLYHEKIGVFGDALGHRVSFVGSANETWSAWHHQGNFESIEVFCNWGEPGERDRVRKHEQHFDALWSGNDPDVFVEAFPQIALDVLRSQAHASLEDITVSDLPPVAARRDPLPHQEQAIAGWKAQGCRGVFKHATGSGKTFTALLALKEHAELGLPALVLVPSRLLLDQWADEIRDEIPDASLLIAGGGHSKWRSGGRLRAMTGPDPSLGPRIVLSTMQTASTNDFMKGIVSADHLLIVADEVHQVGSPQNSGILQMNAGKRLGLSATPERYGDPDGTRRIFEYFGEIVPPPITLIDAIRAGRLVPYEYYPHPIHLTAEEADAWRQISTEISREIARSRTDETGARQLSARAKLLLIQRARIAKKAAVKVRLARQVITANFEEGQHWLVYCEDSSQLSEVLEALREGGLRPIEYHSNMPGDRVATMEWFRKFGGILVSIRCLDEGVDIPAVSHALILASSQNPRQFIQRRGRVLRTAAGKHLAVIHDAIVVPTNLGDEPEQTALLRAELIRAIEFAQHAMNRMAAAELREIAADLGLDFESLTGEGTEEDEIDE
jgi:superfamily II DNA or RNA helicase